MEERVFGRRYRITEKIGSGGMAEVYKAQDEVLGRTVAIKVMLPQYASDRNFAARFRQEAQAAANLQNPYIVNIYDWGQDDGTYYIAMEYVRGTDLKTAIEQRGAINQRKVAEIGSQVCSALSVAHGYDIIHRDIKPHNIMVQPDGNSKVMDFGIARAGNTTMTQTSSVLGTAHYVSPEQAQGRTLTAASDLYSLGIVLYEAATGKLPFDAPDAVAVALKQVNEMPVPPSQINPDLDPAFEAIILRALEKNPEDRFASAGEMRAALNAYLAGRPLEMGSSATTVIGNVPMRENPPMADRTSVMSAVGNDGRYGARSGTGRPVGGGPRSFTEPKPKKWPIVVALIAAVLVIGVIIAYALGAFNGSSTETATVPTLVGLEQGAAETLITDEGFVVGDVTEEYSDTVEEGLVISQDPEAETEADAGSTINLVVSQGVQPAETVDAPDLSGMTADQAEAALEALGLVGAKGEGENSDTVDAGEVLSQDPASGESIEVGSTVTYVLSLGAADSEIPDVVGMTRTAAKTELEEAGFSVTVERASSSTVDEGDVISQSPDGGDSAAAGATVTITVSTGPEMIDVPDVVGMTEAKAIAAIEKLGLVAEVSYSADQDTGTVLEQDPSSGTVEEGSTINILVDKGTADADQ